jgi:hypothetical protein
MTLAQVKAELRAIGVAIRKQDGEYRVNARGGAEEAAYYTNDLDDALQTGRKMVQPRIDEANQEKVDRWVSGSLRGVSYSDVVDAGWEAGQATYIEFGEGLRYERFPINGGYVVIEWDEAGNVCVC